MASGCDEVKHGVHAVVPEARVTLDTRLLGQNVVVLPLEEANNLGKARSLVLAPKSGRGFASDIAPGLVVDLVTETWGVHDRQGDTGSLLIKLELCVTSQTSIEQDRKCER